MKARFNAWKEGFPIYASWLAAGILLCAFSPWGLGAGFGVVFLLLGLFAVYFFRDPARQVTEGPGLVVSPADGHVIGIDELTDSPHYAGPCKRVAIFLSVFDVHINRAPVAGTVRSLTYQPGKYLAAMKGQASEANEAMTIHLDTAYGPVTVRQIAGLVARRIVCRAGVGDALEHGEKFGMIKFGSRTEIFLPPGVDIHVTMNEMVRAGITVIGRMP